MTGGAATGARGAPSRHRFIHRHAPWLAAAALVCMAALLVHAAFHDSPTIDEPFHVVRGMAHVATGDARFSVAHPPLGNLLQGIPGRLLDRDTDFRSFPGWDDGWRAHQVARQYFVADYERGRAALIGGRLVTVLLTLLLGLYLYRFCLRFGRLPAVLAVALYSFLPVILAHGHLATTDVPLALATTVAVGEFVRWIEGRSRLRFATFALATGAAFATKFSALFLVPVLGLVGLLVALRGGGPWAGRPAWLRLVLLGRDFVAVAAVAILVVNASYGFARTGWTVERTLAQPEPRSWITDRFEGEVLPRFSSLEQLPGWMPIPLPYPWVYGLHTIRAQNDLGHGGWFWGERAPSRLYFPTMAVIKSPAALLLLLVAGLFLLRWRRLGTGGRLALWLVPLGWLGASLSSEIQIGVRHLLPIFPFAAMAAGWAAARLWIRWPAVGALAVALAAAEALAVAPGYLGHFSWAIGGARIGQQISVVGEDWGQDLGALARYVEAHDLGTIYYKPYGFHATRELRAQGLRFNTYSCRTQLAEPAWVAVHANQFVRFRRACGAIGVDLVPERTVEGRILLFRVEPPALQQLRERTSRALR